MAQSCQAEERAKAARVPVIYCNDNFGDWRSDFKAVLTACTREDKPARDLVQSIAPGPGDYFILKPKHSAFYETTLDLLLRYLGAKTLIFTGIAGNICILFSANDAYMRDFNLLIPSDCVVSNTPEENEHAFEQMRSVLKADTRRSDAIDFSETVRW